MAAVFALAILWRRRWHIVAAAGGIGVVLAIGLALPYFSPSSAPLPGTGRVLTIVTFNTWLRQYEWRDIERYVRETKPDFVVLVEAGRAIKPLFAALRDLYPWQEECAAWRRCHMAVLSRHRWQSAKFERRGPHGPPVIRAKFGPQLGNLTLVGTHLSRPPHMRTQLRQIRALSKRLRAMSGPVVAAGDFNATPWSLMYKTFSRISGLRGFSGIAPSWPTYPFNLPQLPIDHVFVSKSLGVRLLEVGPPLGSDHRVIRTEIRLPAK